MPVKTFYLRWVSQQSLPNSRVIPHLPGKGPQSCGHHYFLISPSSNQPVLFTAATGAGARDGGLRGWDLCISFHRRRVCPSLGNEGEGPTIPKHCSHPLTCSIFTTFRSWHHRIHFTEEQVEAQRGHELAWGHMARRWHQTRPYSTFSTLLS